MPIRAPGRRWLGRLRRHPSRLGAADVLKCALALVVTVLGAQRTTGTAVWFVILGALLAGIALLGPWPGPTRVHTWVLTANMAVDKPVRLPVVRRVWESTAWWVGLGGLIAGALGLQWWQVPVVAAVLASAAIRASWVLAPSSAARQRARILHELSELRPAVVVCFAGGTGGASYQMPMWLPQIDRVGLPYLVVTQSAATVPEIARWTSAPVVCVPAEDRRLLRSVLVPSLRVALYVKNTKRNRVFLRHSRLTHVWLNHGDSDKPANFNPLHREFDVLFVAGPVAVERYAEHGVRIPAERFEIVGRPQAAGIRFEPDSRRGKTAPVVLYAPTWSGVHDYDNFTSLPVGAGVVRALLDRGATVIFRPHPLSRTHAERAFVEEIDTTLEDDARESGRAHVWGRQAERTWSVEDCINRSDALVSDVSSVVSDYLASGKPYALVAVTVPAAQFREQFASAGAGYVVEPDLSNIESVLDEMLGADPLAQQRQELRRRTLGDFAGDESASAFAAAVRRLAGAAPKGPSGSHDPTSQLGSGA